MESLTIRWACSALERFFGLLRKDVCTQGEVLVLTNCASVHTFGMREALDIVFLDKHAQVLKSVRDVQPGHLLLCKKAVCILERRSDPGSPWPLAGDILNLFNKLTESETR